MSRNTEFSARFGALKEYRGHGGQVSIPRGVKKITSLAFNNCRDVTEITVPEGVSEIKEMAFYGCDRLEEIKLPASIKNIGTMAFRGCNALKRIDLSSDNEIFSCEDSMLVNEKQHKLIILADKRKAELDIPEGIVSVEPYAFEGNTQLREINIPSSVITFDKLSLTGCTGLEKINVSADNPSYATRDGVLFDKALSILLQFPLAKTGSYELPAGVKEITAWAFGLSRQYTAIDRLVIADSVQKLGLGALAGCGNLKSLTMPYISNIAQDNSVPNMLFDSLPTDCVIHCPVPSGIKLPEDYAAVLDQIIK